MSADELDKSNQATVTKEVEGDVIKAYTSDQQTYIKIFRDHCKGCDICAEVCPKDVLSMINAIDKWEGTMVEITNMEACNACMLCEKQCPDFAIEVYNAKKEQKKKEKRALAKTKS